MGVAGIRVMRILPESQKKDYVWMSDGEEMLARIRPGTGMGGGLFVFVEIAFH